jgi:hypothetical protein
VSRAHERAIDRGENLLGSADGVWAHRRERIRDVQHRERHGRA